MQQVGHDRDETAAMLVDFDRRFDSMSLNTTGIARLGDSDDSRRRFACLCRRDCWSTLKGLPMCICVRSRLLCAVSSVAVFASLAAAEAAEDYSDASGMSEIGSIEEFSLDPVSQDDSADPRPTPFVVNARADYQFGAGIDTAGDFSVVRAMGGAGFGFPIGEKLIVATGVGFNYAGYDFDRSPAFGGGEPWEDIYSAVVTSIGNYTINDQWSAFGGGIFAFSGEDGASFSDSFTGGGVVGGGYRFSKNLMVRLGVSVMSQLEDDVSVLPVLMVDWKIDERWRFRVGSLDIGTSDVAGAGLSYKFTEPWSLGGRISYVQSRFRLDDSGFAPEGVGQDERFKATLALNWHPSQTVELTVLGGLVFGGELQIEDENGDRLFKEDYDTTPFVGARFAWRF
jgi:hypothetical protein